MMRKAERSMNDGYGAGEKFGWGHVPSNPREVDMSEGIRSVVVTKDEQGNVERVRLLFGPHHYVTSARKRTGASPSRWAPRIMASRPMLRK